MKVCELEYALHDMIPETRVKFVFVMGPEKNRSA